ncbi:hypothetical protein [Streptacidiphilus melanogenes]|uniref:hypothetical protein n=1 Tax=Streptacidiphilus melanogenes TaxID=411235 RepID=UPI000693A279|nr:hypothetical protein [Streptacidiphilus melanogenes]
MTGMLREISSEYPHLGFNPVPGVPADVTAVTTALTQATNALRESGSLLGQVEQAGSGLWEGAAGDAFRGHLDSELTQRLQTAQTSLERALGVLTDWGGHLVDFKGTASRLDAEAAAAQAALDRADARLKDAQANPDLSLAGQTFDNQQALDQAQQALNTAVTAVNDAQAAVNDARAQLESVLRRAQELASEHEALARRCAQELDHAAHDLAPHKPGMFSRLWNDFTSGLGAVGHWISTHLDLIHNILSTVSAIAGLIALCTPPPIDVVAGAIALVAGAGALATDLANPQFRKGIGELLTGHVNKESLGALATGVGDVLSVVPGGAALGKMAGVGLKAAVKGTEVATEGAGLLPKFYDIAKVAADNPGILAKGLAKSTALQTKVLGAAAKDADELGQVATKVGIGLRAKNSVKHVYTDLKEAF